MPRSNRSAQRRAEIERAMVRVMARRGYSGASIALVAEEAGLSPGLLHYHFNSKLDLLLAVVERLARDLHERFAALGSSAPTPRERLMAWIDTHLGEIEEPGRKAALSTWVTLGGEAVRESAVRSAYRRVLMSERGRLLAIVDAAGGESPRSDSDAEVLADALLLAVEGAARIVAIAPEVLGDTSPATIVKAIADRMLRRPGIPGKSLDGMIRKTTH